MSAYTGADKFALQTFDAMEIYLRASGHREAADELAKARRELELHFEDRDQTPDAQMELAVLTATPTPARKLPRRDRDPNYRLHVESITYVFGDFAVTLRGEEIEEFHKKLSAES